jgi:MprA protease rhombosortase-interaction domain-containing protein
VGYPVSVSGNGVLATVTFKALGAGTSFLDLSNVLLQNFQGSEITAEWTNGVADIQEGNNAIPSPATPLLLLSGWLGFCLRRRLDKCQ